MMTVQSLPPTLAEAKPTTPLGRALSAFVVSSDKLHALTREFETTFRRLAAEAENQFLPTPISSTLLAPIAELGKNEGPTTRFVLPALATSHACASQSLVVISLLLSNPSGNYPMTIC